MAVKKFAGLLDYIIDEFDPRFANQVGSSSLRKGEIANTKGTRVTVEDAPEIDYSPIDLRDYEGRGIMTSMSDRTAGGGVLTSIDGVPLNIPVSLEGGQNFMFLNPGSVWASDPRVVRQMLAEAQRLRAATGKDPLFAPFMMGPGGKDFSNMPGDAMLSFIDSTATKKLKNDLTQQIRTVVPEFKGFDGKWYEQYGNLTGDQRKAIKAVLDLRRNDTGIGLGKARVAVSDKDQLTGRDGTLLNVGVVDTSKQTGKSSHRTYPGDLKGSGEGRLEKPDVLVTELFPETVSKTTGQVRKVADPKNPTHSDIRAFQMRPVGGIVDDKMLKRIYGALAGTGGGLLTYLGGPTGPQQAMASPVPGGFDMPSAQAVSEGMQASRQEGNAQAANAILEELLGFMAPTSMGGGIDTMEGYLRSQTR